MKYNLGFDLSAVKTPYYAIDERLLEKNLKMLRGVMDASGCKILLAQKCFSTYQTYPLIGQYLTGVTASGLFEAKLGHEEMRKENHIFSPSYDEAEFDEIMQICDCIIFNSFDEWNKLKGRAIGKGKKLGLRINPEKSTQNHAIYDPCSRGSRLGITLANFHESELEGINGLHFHTLCEQNVDALETTLVAVEEKFGKYLSQMSWINFGGGHHITRSDYDRERLIKVVKDFKARHNNIEVYLEPGEAVALDAGFVVAKVTTFVANDIVNAIVDTSPSCHMPDVLEMPYRPRIIGSGEAEEKAYTYRLGGGTCLAGDIIGDYSFDEQLKVGDYLVFEDMAIYSMVKNNFFNGINLPKIVVVGIDGTPQVVKEFGYKDFKDKL